MQPLTCALLASLATAAVPDRRTEFTPRAALSPYAPVPAVCPSSALVRPANSVASAEQAYYSKRKPIATKALKSYLSKTGVKFPALSKAADYPTVALTTSGGGYRSLLVGAGVHQAYDLRDGGNYTTAGLYQACTYEAGLSGGAWLLSSIAANNYPTISSLQHNLWESAFAEPSLVVGGPSESIEIAADVAAKDAAGFNVSIVDPYGRMLSYQFLYGTDGGVADYFSQLTTLSNFTSYNVPFPIITSIGVDTDAGQCLPPDNGTQYEFSPYEFGSWDSGVNAFTLTQYLGSSLSNGKPVTPDVCVKNFDQMGFIFGTSSDIFPYLSCTATTAIDDLPSIEELEALLPAGANSTSEQPELVYGLYPNPFYRYAHSSLVSAQTQLTLTDGGLSNQNNPIWPFLHRPEVDVLLVNDNSADTSDNYPNGTEIYVTYQQAMLQGLGNRMPVIPTADTFVAQGLNTHPTFFGCNSTNSNTLAIAWIPNYNYTYDSGTSTFMLEYTAAQTDAMISNGNAVGSYNNTKGFDSCLGCLIMKKAVAKEGKTLPKKCTKCFSQFCYN